MSGATLLFSSRFSNKEFVEQWITKRYLKDKQNNKRDFETKLKAVYFVSKMVFVVLLVFQSNKP